MGLVAHGLLGLLEPRCQHGYELRQAYDRRFRADQPIRSGQIYSTLTRLERDGLIDPVGDEPGNGPERRLLAVTSSGVAELERWLEDPEPVDLHLRSALYMKVVLALSSGRAAQAVLDRQREEHLAVMQRLTRDKATGDVQATVQIDFQLFHIEADLRWIDLTVARLEKLGRELEP